MDAPNGVNGMSSSKTRAIAQYESDTLILGYRVSAAINAENLVKNSVYRAKIQLISGQLSEVLKRIRKAVELSEQRSNIQDGMRA